MNVTKLTGRSPWTSRFYISDTAFADEGEEHAHFDTMRGRLDALTSIHQRLDDALNNLRVAHTSIGTEVQEMSEYISALQPRPSRVRAKRVAVETTTGSSGVKSFAMKLRVCPSVLIPPIHI